MRRSKLSYQLFRSILELNMLNTKVASIVTHPAPIHLAQKQFFNPISKTNKLILRFLIC